jgi:hypothetical protein
MAERVMPIDDTGPPQQPRVHKENTKNKRRSGSKPGLASKPSRFFFMDASGQLVDTTLSLSALIPRFMSCSMEEQYRVMAFDRWRHSSALNLLTAFLIVLGPLASMGSWTLPDPFALSISRISAAITTIVLVIMLKFRKWALKPRVDHAMLLSVVAFSVSRWLDFELLYPFSSCPSAFQVCCAVSTTNMSVLLVATLVAVALSVVECDEKTAMRCTALAAVTATVLHATLGPNVPVLGTFCMNMLSI